MIPFTREPDGVVTARFTRDEAAILRDLADQLVAMLRDRSGESGGEPADVLYAQLGIGGAATVPLDPALARLLPDAYRGDDEAASEHRRFTERGLVDRKIENALVVFVSLDTGGTPVLVRLDGPRLQSWLRTLTDLRLTIAARLQIETDGDEGIVETESDAALLAVYDWLGYLQGSLVEAIDV